MKRWFLVVVLPILLALGTAGQEEANRDAQTDFVGVRNKKSIVAPENLLEDQVNDKRGAPKGFTATRGKKDTSDQLNEMSMVFKRSPFQEFQKTEDAIENYDYPFMAFEYNQGDYSDEVGDSQWQDDKRAPKGFFGVRGKKAPSRGFYGVRGKKAPSRGFYGVRGKKAPMPGFYGVRGKKAPMPGFYGVRGKKVPLGFQATRGKKDSSPEIDSLLHLLNDKSLYFPEAQVPNKKETVASHDGEVSGFETQ